MRPFAALLDRPLRSRNPLVLGFVGTAALVATLLAVIVLPRVPALSSTRSYSANFAQAAGLSSGDDVRVAGIPEGTVTGVHLDRDVIQVDFTLPKSVHIGADTTASIEVATLLGTKYVELVPAGPGELTTSAPIPLARTRVP